MKADPQRMEEIIRDTLVSSSKATGQANPMQIAAATFILRMDQFIPETKGYTSRAAFKASQGAVASRDLTDV